MGLQMFLEDPMWREALLRGRQGTIGEKHSTREPRDIRRVSGKKQFYEGVKRKQYHESVRHVCLQLPLVLFNALCCTYSMYSSPYSRYSKYCSTVGSSWQKKWPAHRAGRGRHPSHDRHSSCNARSKYGSMLATQRLAWMSCPLAYTSFFGKT